MTNSRNNTTTPARAVSGVGRAATWAVWHLPELIGVTVPGVVAVVWTPWAALVSVLVAAGWAVHEVRTARRVSTTAAAPVAPRALRHADGDDQVACATTTTTPPAGDEPAGAVGGGVGPSAPADGGRVAGGAA